MLPRLASYPLHALLAAVMLLTAGACGSPAEPSAPEASAAPEAAEEPSGTVSLYTSVTQDTVDAVVAALAEEHPGIQVEVFRAPTGELNARLAAEERSGGIQADVIWHTDPPSMYAHESQELLLDWTPEGAQAVPAELQTPASWGTRVLNLVIVHHTDAEPAPEAWVDLTDPAYRDGVALPDPGFAGSAFAALGYFGLTPEFGMDYYRSLQANGAVQVQAVNDVITGVAEGRFVAGMALDKTVQDAIDGGAPIEMVWPEPGAIALYSPIAVFAATSNEPAARAFVEFVLTEPAQEAIAGTGWQPVLGDVESPFPPAGAKQVFPGWEDAFGRQDDLLAEYRTIFGG